jgi:hypothetical protein
MRIRGGLLASLLMIGLTPVLLAPPAQATPAPIEFGGLYGYTGPATAALFPDVMVFTVTSTGETVVGGRRTGELFTIDADTDALVPLAQLGGPLGRIVAAPSGGSVYVATQGLVTRVDPDGSTEPVAGKGPDFATSSSTSSDDATTVSVTPGSLAVSPSGELYIAEGKQIRVVESDGSTEVVATLAQVGLPSNGRFAGVAASASQVYVTSTTQNRVHTLLPSPAHYAGSNAGTFDDGAPLTSTIMDLNGAIELDPSGVPVVGTARGLRALPSGGTVSTVIDVDGCGSSFVLTSTGGLVGCDREPGTPYDPGSRAITATLFTFTGSILGERVAGAAPDVTSTPDGYPTVGSHLGSVRGVAQEAGGTVVFSTGQSVRTATDGVLGTRCTSPDWTPGRLSPESAGSLLVVDDEQDALWRCTGDGTVTKVLDVPDLVDAVAVPAGPTVVATSTTLSTLDGSALTPVAGTGTSDADGPLGEVELGTIRALAARDSGAFGVVATGMWDVDETLDATRLASADYSMTALAWDGEAWVTNGPTRLLLTGGTLASTGGQPELRALRQLAPSDAGVLAASDGAYLSKIQTIGDTWADAVPAPTEATPVTVHPGFITLPFPSNVDRLLITDAPVGVWSNGLEITDRSSVTRGPGYELLVPGRTYYVVGYDEEEDYEPNVVRTSRSPLGPVTSFVALADDAQPAAPTDLTTFERQTSVTLDWKEPTEPDPTFDGFVASYLPGTSAPTAPDEGTALVTTPAATTFTARADDLEVGSTYTATVWSTDLSGNLSDPVSASFALDVTPPPVPGLTLTPGVASIDVNAVANSADTDKIIIASAAGAVAPTDPSAPGVLTISPDSFPYGLYATPGQQRTVTVWAVDRAGNISAGTSASTIALNPPPGPPGPPRSVTAVAGDGQGTISWTAPISNGGTPITGYTATASPSGKSCTTTTTTCTITGLTNGTMYTISVTATNAVGTSPNPGLYPSPLIPTAPPPPTQAPSSPVGLVANGGTDRVTLTWGAPVDDGDGPVTRYSVTSSTGSTWDLSAASRSFTIAVAPGTAYTFSVRAHNSAGASPAAVATTKGTRIALSAAASTVDFGATTALRGRLTDTSGSALSGQFVRVFAKPAGASTYELVATVRSGSGGAFAAGVRPVRGTAYYATYLGGPGNTGRASALRAIAVRGTASIKVARKAKPGAKIRVTGRVAPGSAGTKVSLQRTVRGSWRTVRTTASRATGSYALTWRTKKRTKHRLRVVTRPADGLLAGASQVRKVTVRR